MGTRDEHPPCTGRLWPGLAEAQMAFAPLSQLQVDLGALPGSADVGREGGGGGGRLGPGPGPPERGQQKASGSARPCQPFRRPFVPILHLSQHLLTPGAPIRGARAGTPSHPVGFGEQDVPSVARGTGTHMRMGTWAHPAPRTEEGCAESEPKSKYLTPTSLTALEGFRGGRKIAWLKIPVSRSIPGSPLPPKVQPAWRAQRWPQVLHSSREWLQNQCSHCRQPLGLEHCRAQPLPPFWYPNTPAAHRDTERAEAHPAW